MILKETSGRKLDTLLARLRSAAIPAGQNRWMWLETLVISLCAIALGLLLQQGNPFQVGAEFPWTWLAPVLVALRYGVMPGVGSSLVLLGAWLLLPSDILGKSDFPEQYFLGGLILVMICGEFSAAWGTRLRRAEESNHYLDERLGRITRRHLLLSLSHERMEQEALSKPASLRDALISLRQMAVDRSGTAVPAVDAILQLVAQYCQLESAAIYIEAAGGEGYRRLAEIGTPIDLAVDDPLLLHALKHKSLAHLLTEGLLDAELPSPFLVVAPIMTSGGRLLGILGVNRMPFFALNDETLQMLAVMLGYYADCAVESEGTKRFLDRFAGATPDFAEEYARLLRLQRTQGINSHMVALAFANDDMGRQAVAQITRIRRGLDVVWQVSDAHRTLVVNLMPLASEAAVEGYLLRIENLLKEQLGSDYDGLNAKLLDISLAEEDPCASLAKMLAGQAQ